MAGDFNFDKDVVEWKERDGVVYGDVKGERQSFQALMNLTNSFFMSQMISRPTRENNTLDLVFMTDVDSVYRIDIDELPGKTLGIGLNFQKL